MRSQDSWGRCHGCGRWLCEPETVDGHEAGCPLCVPYRVTRGNPEASARVSRRPGERA